MLRFYLLITCILFISSTGSSHGGPLDSSDIVYIDGLPCNRACQSYMAWSRKMLPLQASPVSSQPASRQIAQPSSRTKAQRTTTIRSARDKAALPRVTKRAIPPSSTKASPPNSSDPQSARREEEILARNDERPPTASEPGRTPEQIATSSAGEEITTGTAIPAPPKEPDRKNEPSGSSAATFPADTNTTALAPPNEVNQLIAILVVRPEIRSVSDLKNGVVAIDGPPSDYSAADINRAIVAAGAAEVRLSEDQKMALLRVIDGDVQAAVVTVLSPRAAEAWNAGVTGFNVLRIPLWSPSDKAKRG